MNLPDHVAELLKDYGAIEEKDCMALIKSSKCQYVPMPKVFLSTFSWSDNSGVKRVLLNVGRHDIAWLAGIGSLFLGFVELWKPAF